MFDKIEKIGDSWIQHGPNNDRIYLMKLSKNDFPDIIDKLHNLSILKNYTKIFAKVPAGMLVDFLANDFKKEATIPGFFNGKETVHFVSRFIGATRSFISATKRMNIKNILDAAKKKRSKAISRLQSKVLFRRLGPTEVPQLAQLYDLTFKVYPFPICKEDYLMTTMSRNSEYYGAFLHGQLIAASSAEMDVNSQNAEMTDFATHPDYRGKNLSYFLLKEMEKKLAERNFKTLFTIARAESIGMNATFARGEYNYGGTLINNTQIGERIESMNVWFKSFPSLGGSSGY